METSIPKTLLDSFSNYISKHLGLDFSQDRAKDLQRGLREMAREHHIEDIATFVCQLIAAPPSASRIEMLSKHFTVCETYFMREQATLNALQTIILPELIRERQQTDRCLKIWSAGCATGEEPYTIAMILHELLPDIRDWHIMILATDANPYAIGKARTGQYTKWSFRRTPNWVCSKYFCQTQDKRFEIIPEIKNMVRFAQCNLAELDFPRLQNHTHGLDIIFCRNVLMYFTEECRNEILS